MTFPRGHKTSMAYTTSWSRLEPLDCDHVMGIPEGDWFICRRGEDDGNRACVATREYRFSTGRFYLQNTSSGRFMKDDTLMKRG